MVGNMERMTKDNDTMLQLIFELGFAVDDFKIQLLPNNESLTVDKVVSFTKNGESKSCSCYDCGLVYDKVDNIVFPTESLIGDNSSIVFFKDCFVIFKKPIVRGKFDEIDTTKKFTPPIKKLSLKNEIKAFLYETLQTS